MDNIINKLVKIKEETRHFLVLNEKNENNCAIIICVPCTKIRDYGIDLKYKDGDSDLFAAPIRLRENKDNIVSIVSDINVDICDIVRKESYIKNRISGDYD